MTAQGCADPRRVRLGTSELRDTGTNELILIARVNEAIKLAIRASEAITLIAVNANLVARRAGDSATGFCVVAGELRRFSHGIAAMMQGWSELIYALVDATANSRNQIRCLNGLRAAGDCSEEARLALALAAETSRQALHATNIGNSEKVIELQRMIVCAQKLRVTGELIARSAMIESAYGGQMRQVLQQIAGDIAASIAELNSHTAEVAHLIGKVNA